MNYLDVIFPEELSYCFDCCIDFLTSMAILKNKQEIRNQKWIEPRYKYNLIYKNCNERLYQKLNAFFLICKGKKNCFNFLDKNDCKIENQQIGVGNGETKDFNIYKIYSYENLSIQRNIYKTSNEVIYINNKIIDSDNYTIKDGILSFKDGFIPKEGDLIFIDCIFYVIVRFENDYLVVNRKDNLIELQDVCLIEVRK